MPGLPFQVPDAQIAFVVMTAQADARTLRVLFDTGDAVPFVIALAAHSPAAADARPTGEPDFVTHAVAGGDSAILTPATLPSFHLGPIQLSAVRVGLTSSIDLVSRHLPGGVDAAVGYELVSQRIVGIDYRRHRIDFAAEPGPEAQAAAMVIAPGRPLSVVEATINGRGPFRLVIDTGAAVNVLSPEAAARAGVGPRGPKVRLSGAGGDGTVGQLERAEIDIGPRRWPGATVVVADMMRPASAEAGLALDGLLGAPVLAHGRLILDYPGRRIWIGESSRR